MRTWKYKVNIKQYLTDDESWQGIVEASNGVAKELRTLPEHLFEDLNFEDDVEFLESVSIDDKDIYGWESELLNEVNFRLSNIYDFADYEDIWLGL